MSFEQYLATPAVIDIVSEDKTGSFRELASVLCKAAEISKQKPILEEILKREESSSTFIGNGVALPHARGCPIKEEFAIVVGRSIAGINYDAARNASAHIVILLVSREDAENTRQIEILAEIAAFFKSEEIREQILSQDAVVDLRVLSAALKKGLFEKKERRRAVRKTASPILGAAMNLARDFDARAIMVFADVVKDNDFLEQLGARNKLIIVTNNKTRFDLTRDKKVIGVVQAPPIPVSRTSQLKIGILLALSRGFVKKEDKIVCVSGGVSGSIFDTIVCVDIAMEYDFFFLTAHNLLPSDIKPEVFERVIGLAGEMAVEGREGKPLGTIFVLGDTNSVNGHVRQLIINPFRGYSEAERNIIDPGLTETIKEFASIDGAFIITGDGVILSAGSYLRPQVTDSHEMLPGGFGARHAAAAGITSCTKALAITISESTGMVNIFKNGTIMLSLSKPMVRGREVTN
ncbi:MAG: PTS sugar transporter subunit IIA [Chitinispirillales bacterium]|jgi:mannitol/fructose-specific phosphotransferase system IIA component (Ntr-type)|nr:PTS sugar transporter subunit IIA [Chitinispirillales bacterium]